MSGFYLPIITFFGFFRLFYVAVLPCLFPAQFNTFLVFFSLILPPSFSIQVIHHITYPVFSFLYSICELSVANKFSEYLRFEFCCQTVCGL